MARPKSGRQTDNLRCRVDSALKAKLDMYLYDPAHGNIKYGALGKLCEKLIIHFFAHVDRVGPKKAFADFGIDIADLANANPTPPAAAANLEGVPQ